MKRIATAVAALLMPLVAASAEIHVTCSPNDGSDISISIYPNSGWSVSHNLTNGTVVQRKLQYDLFNQNVSGPTYTWRGTLKRNPSLTMVGTLRQTGSDQFSYNESLYDEKKNGQKVNDVTATCLTAGPTAQPVPQSLAASSAVNECKPVVDPTQRLACYDKAVERLPPASPSSFPAPQSDEKNKTATVADMRRLCEMQRSDAIFDECGRLLEQMLDGLIQLGRASGKPLVCLPSGRPSTQELKTIFMSAAAAGGGKVDNLPVVALFGYSLNQRNGCPDL